MSSLYSGVELDPENHSVHLYLTDVERASEFLRAARLIDNTADYSLVQVRQGAYTRAELRAARDRLAGARDSLSEVVEDVSVPPDGSGLLVGVPPSSASLSAPSAAVPADISASAGVAVKMVPGNTETGASRFSDTPHFGRAHTFRTLSRELRGPARQESR